MIRNFTDDNLRKFYEQSGVDKKMQRAFAKEVYHALLILDAAYEKRDLAAFPSFTFSSGEEKAVLSYKCDNNAIVTNIHLEGGISSSKEIRSTEPCIVLPGATIKYFIRRYNIYSKDIATAAQLQPISLSNLIHNKKIITAPIALKLGKLFNTSPQFWLNLQREYELSRVSRNIETQAILKKIKALDLPKSFLINLSWPG